MRLVHISADFLGGAGRAAYRLHRALVEDGMTESEFITQKRFNDDWRITVPKKKVDKLSMMVHAQMDSMPLRLQHSADAVPRSAAWMSYIRANEINKSEYDVVNLHWICQGFLSIEQIGKLMKPVVWSLHDMWPFCGSEHLSTDDVNSRWRTGYTKQNRTPADSGFDIDRWVWRRKKKSWERPMSVVTPSRWLAECARASSLMHNWDITVIPNTLDINRFKPVKKSFAREILCLPPKPKLILFGAIQGTQVSYKGWDLLVDALDTLSKKENDTQVVVFGQGEPKCNPEIGMPIHWMGHLYDDATLSLLYSAVDVVVVPSRQESFGQTASEAQACGCPVVAFNTTGLRDVVKHKTTGYLAQPYSCDDLAIGIEWVLSDEQRNTQLSIQARDHAISSWSHEVVIEKYIEVYRRAMETHETSWK